MRSSSWSVGLRATVAILAGGAAISACAATNHHRARARRSPVTVISLRAPRGTPVLRVGAVQRTRPIAPGFIGLSVEFNALPAYIGRDPKRVDPVFEQLVRNLAPGQRPVLRIGGDSTDHTWIAVPGMRRPLGVTYTVGHSWLSTTGALARALDARMILGINLEADSERLARTEGRAMVAAIGPALDALELGNEPELYSTFAWYHVGEHNVHGRGRGWGVPSYVRDIPRIARSLPPVPVGGPATGAADWIAQLDQIAAATPRIAVATVHRYPLARCFTPKLAPNFPTIPNLLASRSSTGLASSVADYAEVAHARGLAVRVDEFNTASCEGKLGVSDTFASALWALDGSFAMARVGVDGVNVHTLPGAVYEPFTLRHAHGSWSGNVRPMYYGLMMFAQAAPPGSRLLEMFGSPGQRVRRWATRAPDGTIRVVLINENVHRPRYVALQIPGRSRPAALERLQAPSLVAKHGVKLGGRSFGAPTTTGLLTGRARSYAIGPVAGRYAVRLPAASAAMLTLPPPGATSH